MIETKVVCNHKVMVQSPIPIWRLLEMEINDSLNEHGTLRMKVRIHSNNHEKALTESYQKEKIQIFGFHGDDTTLIFCGMIRDLLFDWSGQVLEIQIYAVSYSIDLEQETKSRSFQNPAFEYEHVIEQVMRESGGRFLWRVERNRKIEHPIIQYKENNWVFLKRLASHFHRKLQVSITTDKADIYFGINKGAERDIEEVEVLECGVSNLYYLGDGYTQNHSKAGYRYLKLRHKSSKWQMGDYLKYQRSRFTVFERKIIFEKGELMFYETLGAEGMLHQEYLGHEKLSGMQLQGEITRVEEENVYIQLDIDEEERAEYPWPWIPETGNLCYVMPEVGSRILLTITSDREKDGMATHILRMNEIRQDANHREFLTKDDKLLAMHPKEILLRGETAMISMMDGKGIMLKSDQEIKMIAEGNININAGNELSVEAPDQVLLQNRQSNIELCKNINIFSPGGVIQKS